MRKLLPVLCLAVAAAAPLVHADTRNWNGTTGNWSDAARWGGTVPQPGDDAVIGSGSVTLSADTAALGSLTMGGGTLIFTNWTTTLIATHVVINGGTMTLPAAFTDTTSNRVHVACSNLTLAAGAAINVDSKGYKASPASLGTAYGPGAPAVSAHYGGGAGYGGRWLR